MTGEERTVAPGPDANSVRQSDGTVVAIPAGWALLPPGDAALTRRVKQQTDHWVVQERKGRKMFSRGVWAAAAVIERIRAELAIERADPGFARRQQAARARREEAQADYVDEFRDAVEAFLGFDSRFAKLARQLADAISRHATPVGSGTVARTRRIPIDQRAQAATIAWLRHQTTGYDGMVIPRVRGRRREIRRILAERSRQLLEGYRQGRTPAADCPLQTALANSSRPAN